MGLITQQVENILGGVSQQPPQQRAQSQGQAMSNGFDSVVHGKQKRPPTTHVALLDSDVTGYTEAFLHEINRSSDEQYTVVIVDGDLRVFDMLTGDEVTVEFPNGKDYLTQQTVTPVYPDAIVYDDFLYPALDDNLAGQTTLQGYTWELLHGTSPYLVDLAGIMEIGGYLDNGKVLLNHEMPVADYTVQVEVTSWTAHTDSVSLWARCPNLTSSDANGYRLFINPGVLSLDCYKNGTQAFGQQTYTPGSDFTGTHTFGLQIVGNVIDLMVDGTSVLSYTDTSGNTGGAAFTAPGYVGVGGQQSGYGTPSIRMAHWITNYYHSSDIPVPPPTVGTLGFRAVTIGDYTFIVNQSVQVGQLLTKTKQQPTDAIIAVKEVDFGTTYSINLNGITVGFSTGTAVAPDARTQLSTDSVTATLIAALEGNPTLDAAFTFTQYGSTIYIVKDNGGAFTLTVQDGLSDEGLIAIQGKTQLFSDLPSRAPNGYLVQITGDPSNQFDNYWVQYNDEGQPQQDGVWLETVGAGELTSLDPSTMPHQLVRQGSLLIGTPNEGTPLPTVGPGAISELPFGPVDVTPPYGRSNIGDHGHYQTFWPDGGSDDGSTTNEGTVFDGTAHTLVFAYDVNSTVLTSGTTMIVQIIEESTTSGDVMTPTVLGQKIYGEGLFLQSETQTYTRSSQAPSGGTLTWRIELTYSTGSTPSESHQGSITPHAEDDPTGVPGLTVSVNKGELYQFDTTISYPVGMTIEIHSTSYTLTSTMTAIALATLLAGKTFSDYTASNPADGELLLTYTGSGPAPGASVTITWPGSTTFFNSDLALTPSGLVGSILKNITDGSSGTVTANSATTVTVAKLTGGADNMFNVGDNCEIIGSAAKYFVFQEAPWTPREVGDLNTNPFPSFTLQAITEVFFDSDRLGFLSRNNVIMSGSDDLYNFFRTTVTDLLDGDLIDVQAASQQVSDFSSAVHWQEGTYLFADEVQTQLVGEPIMSPKTVALVPKTYYPNSQIRPIAMDRRIFFARQRSTACQVFRLERIKFPLVGLEASDAAKAIPTYIAGAPVKLAGDAALEIIAIIADGAPNSVFVYQYHYEAADLVQESWHRWDFDPSVTVLNIDMLDGVLNLILLRSDGVYLETIDTQVALYDSV